MRQEDEQDGSCNPDGGVGGQQADGEGRPAHQGEGEDQYSAAAELVSQVAAPDGPERAENETDSGGGKCYEGCRGSLERGEVELGEDEGGGVGVDEEVIPFDRRADCRCPGDPPVFRGERMVF